jgi:hypothetical protein
MCLFLIPLTIIMIILVGFPKSGTTSFQTLFTNLGYNSYHWTKSGKYIGSMIYKNKKNNLPLLNDFCETDVITQMDVCVGTSNAYWPQIIDYEQLYNENSNAIFILNKRDPQKLLDSFKGWGKFNKRLTTFNPELLNNNTDKSFIDFAIKHYTNIESFFQKKTKAKFISFDIEKDKLEILSKYINLKQLTELPHLNKSKGNNNYKTKRKLKGN